MIIYDYIWSYMIIYQGNHNPTRPGKPGRTRTNRPDLQNRFAKAQHDLARNTAHTNRRRRTREPHTQNPAKPGGIEIRLDPRKPGPGKTQENPAWPR